MRRRVVMSIAVCTLVVATLLACGDDELCDTECVGGHLQQICCKSGSICAEPPPFCDLGEGRCTLGDCGSAADAAVDETSTACGTTKCGAGQACVVTQATGGTCELPDDAGLCPGAKVPNGKCCNETTAYACQPIPPGCDGSVTCACAATLCTCDAGSCHESTMTVVLCDCR